MQELIFCFVIITIVLLVKIVIAIVKKKSRKRIYVYAGISLVLAGFITWYLIPVKYDLPGSENLVIEIDYAACAR